MKPVYYLSYSDIPNKDGLIFPSELLPDTYAPGIWVVDFEDFKNMPGAFKFDAVDNNELQTLEMTRINQSVFQVATVKYGKFYFRIINTYFKSRKYVGKSKLIEPSSKLFQVASMNIQKLNEICLKEGFFFVGKVDDNLEDGTKESK